MRKNPTITTSTAGLDPVIPGIEIPIVAGQNQKVLDDGNQMPEVNMSTNDGSNPSISDAPFANGKDQRSHSGGPRSNPHPAMPGA